MITLVTALLSLFFALVSVISYLYNKNKDSATVAGNQAVKDQVSANDAKIQANQAAIDAEKAALAEKEKNETNQSIIDQLNSKS